MTKYNFNLSNAFFASILSEKDRCKWRGAQVRCKTKVDWSFQILPRLILQTQCDTWEQWLVELLPTIKNHVDREDDCEWAFFFFLYDASP